MRDFIIQAAPMLVWLLAITEAVVAIICIHHSHRTLNVLVFLMSLGLAIDAVIIASGTLFGEGVFLQSVSQFRYLLHGLLVPLLILIAFYTYGIKGKMTKLALWILTGVVIVAGIAMGVLTVTEPVDFAGVLRYTRAAATPAFAKNVDVLLSFGGVIPLVLVGIFHLLKHKSPHLMLSGLFMFVFSAIAPATGNIDLNFLTTMFGEVLMVLFFAVELVRSPKVYN